MNRRLNQWRMSVAGLLILAAVAANAQQGMQPQQGPSGQPAAKEVHNFSLQQALDYAKKNSVKVKNALLDYQIQQQSNRATVSEALPQVTGSGGYTDYFQVPSTLVPGIFAGTPNKKYTAFAFGTRNSANYGITLKQLLFDGQVFVGLQARQASLDYASKSREVTEQALRANIYKVYYQLLLSKTQVELIDSNIARVQELQHNTSEMFKNGFAEKLDLDKTTVQLSNLQSEKIQTVNMIDNGYLGLKMLIGMPIRDSR
jgi:outer membrane protein